MKYEQIAKIEAELTHVIQIYGNPIHLRLNTQPTEKSPFGASLCWAFDQPEVPVLDSLRVALLSFKGEFTWILQKFEDQRICIRALTDAEKNFYSPLAGVDSYSALAAHHTQRVYPSKEIIERQIEDLTALSRFLIQARLAADDKNLGRNISDFEEPGVFATWLVEDPFIFGSTVKASSPRDLNLHFNIKREEWLTIFGSDQSSIAKDFPLIARMSDAHDDAYYQLNEIDALIEECRGLRKQDERPLVSRALDKLSLIATQARSLKLAIYFLAR